MPVAVEGTCIMLCAAVPSFRSCKREPEEIRQAKKRDSSVQRTLYSQCIFAGHMGINHGGLKVDVAEKFLYRPDVITLTLSGLRSAANRAVGETAPEKPGPTDYRRYTPGGYAPCGLTVSS